VTHSASGLAADVRPRVADVVAFCDAADAHVAGRGIGDGPRYALRVVLEELLTNVVRYGGVRGEVSIAVDVVADAIAVRIASDGVEFDPTQAAERAAPSNLGSARIGGLGLKMVRSSVRRFTYRREGGRNVVEADIPLAPA
jgi:serine/threonine-protein kinase RsbW